MRHFSLAALLVASIMAIPGASYADDRDEALAAIQACGEISADKVRLACMDAATSLLNSLNATPAVAPPSGEPDIDSQALARERAILAAERENLARERAALDQKAAEQAVLANNAAEAERLTIERAALEAERQELAKARTETADAETENESARKRIIGGLGFFNKDDRPKRYATNVTRIIVNKAGRHFFETEDGTTWRQVPAVELRSPPSALPASVTIRRTASGARRLAFDEHPSQSFVVSETKAD